MDETNRSTKHENEVQMDRRNFLKTAGKTAAGVALGATALSVLSACDTTNYSYPEKEELAYDYVEVASKDTPPMPFKYQKLDPATCAERAYAAYQQQGG